MELFDLIERESADKLLAIMAETMKEIDKMGLDTKVHFINSAREMLHEISPFKSEPVDFVRWVKNPSVYANDYNPNSVAPPEMELLRLSISADGYTQPIVAMPDDKETYEVIDGFHRHRVGKECADIQSRVHGYLPLVAIKSDRREKSDRMAATIRHNRARGKHKVEAMSDIVIELKRRNWADEKIAKELGMEADEVLRLCQISGLAELFSDRDFSQSWEVEGHVSEDDFTEINEDEEFYPDELRTKKVVNTSDENRVFHTYDKWECYKAGFYATTVKGKTKAQCEQEYKELLTNEDEFSTALEAVTTLWVNSCEHYLGNTAMNRIAWLGQAALCYARGIPSDFRSGFQLLTEAEQTKANEIALKYLNAWLESKGRPAIAMHEALAAGRQSEIY
jgi:ParB-like chromosome segregation protein Spo0J